MSWFYMPYNKVVEFVSPNSGSTGQLNLWFRCRSPRRYES
jgi:hypothetical protein